MSYRTIEICWRPQSLQQWAIFTSARREAARLWSDLVERHFRLRRAGWTWPSKSRWSRWAKGKYPGLSAQSTQQIIGEFCEAVESTRQLRRKGHSEARYPWRKPRYRDIPYTNQDARIRAGRLLLPHGRNRTLTIPIPSGITMLGRLMEVRMSFGKISMVCLVEDHTTPVGPTIGIDLGINTLIAATDGTRGILVNGREVKATVQWRNKCLAGIQQRQAKMTKGSRRWKRLQKRKYRTLGKAKRRIRDTSHKATRLIADAFPNAKAFVGEPFNDAAMKMAATQAQTVSQACLRRIISLLDYKLAGVITVNEAYSSQTCPVCGVRNRSRRIYRCKCGMVAARDIIGATNILSIGESGSIQVGRALPQFIKYLRPSRSSSGGHPESSSA